MRNTGWLVALLCCQVAIAEDPRTKAARDELEQELNQMIGSAPTKVRLDFVPLDDPGYVLEEAVFELDGKLLSTPAPSILMGDRESLVWNGDVTSGRHTVKVRVVYANGASVVVSDEGGYKWRVAADVSFDVHSGIEVRVQIIPRRDPTQIDVAKRFKLSLPAKPVMLAKLDDGKIPEPLPAARPVDAGVADLVATKQRRDGDSGQTAPGGGRKIADAQAREERRLAAEARATAQREEQEAALEARRAQREARKAERLARLAHRSDERALVPALAAAPEVLAQNTENETLDAGVEVAQVEAESFDAGTGIDEAVDAGLVVAEPEPVKPPAPVVSQSPSEEASSPWLLITMVGVGVISAALALFLMTRKRS